MERKLLYKNYDVELLYSNEYGYKIEYNKGYNSDYVIVYNNGEIAVNKPYTIGLDNMDNIRKIIKKREA